MKVVLVAMLAFLVCLSILAQDKPKPLPKDIPSLKALAEKGDAEAQFMLGAAYYFGEGVDVDFKLAIDWYKKSAEQGNPRAQFNLGSAYWYGKGAPKDPVQTYKWWGLAAENGYPFAKEWLPKIAPHLTAAQIAEAKKLAEAQPKRNVPDAEAKKPEPPRTEVKKKELEAWASDPSDPQNVIIEKAIRDSLKKSTGELTKKDLAEVTELSLRFKQIRDVSALKGLNQLTSLSLSDNQISDMSPLKGLTHLKELNLHDNQISDVSPLKELKQLTKLSLYNNKIRDVSALRELKQLTSLGLSGNRIDDVSALKELKRLTVLGLSDNPGLTKAQIEELKKALPKCQIHHDATK